MTKTPLQVFEEEVKNIVMCNTIGYGFFHKSQDILTALKTFTESLAVQVEAGKSNYPSFSMESAIDGGNHGDIQAAEARDSRNFTKDEDATIIRQSVKE